MSTAVSFLAHERKPTKRPLRFTLFADIDPAPRKQFLVSKFLGLGEMSCIYAGPGSAKSLLAADCGFHVAWGREWFGRRVTKGGVLYVAAERSKLVERRLAALRKHYGVDDLPFAIVGGLVDLRSSEQHAEEIVGYARDLHEISGERVVLVIVDTVSRVLAGGDENSPKDMGALVSTITLVQEATAAHVMLVHHTPQDGNARMRGHGALLGAVDTSIVVERAGNVRTATIVKDNDGADSEHVSFGIESVYLSTDPETGEETVSAVLVPSDPALTSSDTDPRLTKNQKTMFALVHAAGARGLTTEEWNEKARDAGLGVSRKADLYDFRNALVSKSLVRQLGDRWTVAPC